MAIGSALLNVESSMFIGIFLAALNSPPLPLGRSILMPASFTCGSAIPSAVSVEKITLPLRAGGRVAPMGSWGSRGTPRP
eukprot:1183451-Prorocentrum_minimum.AAC.2